MIEIDLNQQYEIRSRTAMERYELSRPVKFALRDLIINKDRTVFDFGCGRGADVEFLTTMGVNSSGFDPFYFNKNKKKKADVVNLGYVINVIECPEERISVLKEAYSLADICLVVSVQTKSAIVNGAAKHGDGCITQRDTFQKYYSQDELKSFLNDNLNGSVFPVGPGIFYVFKCKKAKNEYLTVRYDSTRLLKTIETPF